MTSFDRKEYTAGSLKLSYMDSGGEKPLLHFYHANGFPTGTYLPLMNNLASDFRVVGLSLPGQDGLGGEIRNWSAIAHDLAGFLDSLGGGPVVGVGHSIGAVSTMICAVKRPDLFSSIIMLDPVIMPSRYILLFRYLKLFNQMKNIPLAYRSLNRRNGWENRDEALEYFRNKRLFREWDEQFFQAYLDYALQPGLDGGIVLVCPPEVESRGFVSYPLDVWRWPRQLRIPVLLVRGSKSFEFSKSSLNRFLRECSTAKGLDVQDAGHCFPMQKSNETIRIIRDFCRV